MVLSKTRVDEQVGQQQNIELNFIRNSYEHEDKLFWVLNGTLLMDFRDE